MRFGGRAKLANKSWMQMYFRWLESVFAITAIPVKILLLEISGDNFLEY
jgi:hypothetical protein